MHEPHTVRASGQIGTPLHTRAHERTRNHFDRVGVYARGRARVRVLKVEERRRAEWPMTFT